MKLRSRIVAFLLLVVVLGATMSTTVQGVLNNIKLGLDLQGGFEVLYQVEPLSGGPEITENDVKDTAQALSRRVNALGVSEPSIQIEGKDRIRVQLAGVDDQESARELLSTEANLTFRDVNDNILLDGNDLKQGGASGSFDDKNRPIVTLKLKDPAKFAEVTGKIAAMGEPNNLLVIWLDFEEGKDSYAEEVKKAKPKFVSAPGVSQVINSSDVQISGAFTVQETKDLSGILNAGALPVKLVEKYSTSVGAQFGDQALKSTVFASLVGIGLIFIFMLVYYRLPGLVANLTLVVFTFLVLVIFDWINAVLTLPGIAAIVLGVGMAVDANILMYERIREELRVGKSIKAAFNSGSKSSFSAIFDANITTLLAAAVLFIFGTSSVKGFATTLMISILVSFITAVWGTRILLGLLVNSGYFDGKTGWFGVSKKKVHKIEEGVDTLDLTTRFDKLDFVHNRKKYYAASLIFIIVGFTILGIFKLNLGIDFSSGTRVEVKAEQQLTKEEVSDFIKKAGFESEDIVISGENKDIGVIRYKEDFSKEEIKTVKAEFKKEFGHEPSISTVSPTVGQELVKSAIKALSIAALGIIIYVAFRFEWRMGVGAIVSLLHDVFFMVALFSFFRLEVDITFIAAVLTIVGYSINDTIVTFDRIRENLHRVGKIKDSEDLANIVNKSLRQTLGRSVNTVLTVIIVVVALLFLGAPSIQNFSIALLIGLITGMYSSIFIAAQVWFSLKKRQMKKQGNLDVGKKKKQWGTDEPVV
ncbi:protein translocase subunit SecDF [Viridibacillus sp. FSL R5-0477]|uniref:Multifunctional fusion protein n=1 Tax=Viridibacillus arenosi FSL R5-213 TaxID=1227360 RepID=W4EQA9_9BACL|nr:MULTISPECIES: protein translocase subunit SecDF [Viridibacillus]ETT82434.1 bifunctional preprotein translocase subunit SecD/SecF [Viridibacillus arenosi FSL R5-213]OMC85411.1 protein translocase subunit SecDF [Viridibacillus sp. FSL H8-0123]OMC92472.1 protein translocase subunit SecDF [Viridibacillus arenosi]